MDVSRVQKVIKMGHCHKMIPKKRAFTGDIGRFEDPKVVIAKIWVARHRSPFGATLPCGCYLVIKLTFSIDKNIF